MVVVTSADKRTDGSCTLNTVILTCAVHVESEARGLEDLVPLQECIMKLLIYSVCQDAVYRHTVLPPSGNMQMSS